MLMAFNHMQDLNMDKSDPISCKRASVHDERSRVIYYPQAQ